MGLMAAAMTLAHAPRLVAFTPAMPEALQAAARTEASVAEVKPESKLELKPESEMKRSRASARVHAAPRTRPVSEAAEELALVSELDAHVQQIPTAEMRPVELNRPHVQAGWVVLAVFAQDGAANPQGVTVSDSGLESPAAQKKQPVRTVWQLLPVMPVAQGWVILEL
jgi:hypothetical protein